MCSLLPLLIAIPAVVLSTEHEAMCRIGVGDAFPAVEGRADSGASVKLETLRGDKATVVAVPGGPKWMTQMMGGDLSKDFAPKYAGRGVGFVSLGAVGEGVKTLAVAEAKLGELLGEGRMPRVYVLDPAGKVVWFDVEYTLSTHRELHVALDELTGQ